MHNKRVLALNNTNSDNGECVIYVMSRDQRINDNHALLAAQKDALSKSKPLVVVFNLLNKSGVRSREHFEFMIEGLKQVEQDLESLSINFIVTQGNLVDNINELAHNLEPSALYFDFNPIRGVRKAQKSVAASVKYPCYVVDAHNIIPVWVLSDKEEFAAHTIRNKVHKNLAEWLTEPPELVRHPSKLELKIPSNDWAKVNQSLNGIDSSRIKVEYASGEEAATKQLKKFISERLSNYASARNIPVQDGQSGLSPYLHFGQISSLRVALELTKEVKEPPLLLTKSKLASFEGEPSKADSVNALLEELIVRKELADNYCFYNKNYDNIEGAKSWALDSLNSHSKDTRDYVYSLEDWETASTHDDAWNAAQAEMMKTGKMHGYMRMYWAKKILEWSKSPEEAVKIAVYLNDKFSIDGGDPNGYTGIMWSIAGVHDRAWFEREVYGKIRYMNAAGLKRKFDIEGYIKKWSK